MLNYKPIRLGKPIQRVGADLGYTSMVVRRTKGVRSVRARDLRGAESAYIRCRGVRGASYRSFQERASRRQRAPFVPV